MDDTHGVLCVSMDDTHGVLCVSMDDTHGVLCVSMDDTHVAEENERTPENGNMWEDTESLNVAELFQ
ncbi:hypothetical protein RRG08_004343 [Elysia crispata]|uniref:Uncharacterized protein n=1 Tax=Elysia crispata TaxID=231223 RepID=A0AAE1AYQ0_9GAST|nr:hypothetical protein RRG08_004343 [Elysia crispata]